MTHPAELEATDDEIPTFCESFIEIETPDGLDEVRCTDRYGHEEAHSAKIWWSS